MSRDCARCGGCADDGCIGCGGRWCNAAATGGGCDACHKPVVKRLLNRVISIELRRCRRTYRHSGDCEPGAIDIPFPFDPGPVTMSAASPPVRRPVVFTVYEGN